MPRVLEEDGVTAERNTIETPVRGDRYADASTGAHRLIAVDALLQEGVRIEIDGAEVNTVPWDLWRARSAGFIPTERAKDPCPNHDVEGNGHVGKRVFVKNLGRCYNRHRCLACGRTYDVDSSD